MVIMIILLCLIGLYIFKLSTNTDIIKENCKTDSDVVNIKNGQKVFYKSRESIILLILFIATLLLCLICNFTNLGNWIMDYISTEIYQPKEFNYNYYYIPAYLIVIREIIVQVKIGDFLYKYFKVTEPELEENVVKNAVMGILYKKKPEEPKPQGIVSDEQKEKKE